MSGAKRARGKYSEAVVLNTKRLMVENRIGQAELRRQLSKIGWDIPILGIRKLLDGSRLVGVDDAAAIAQVFSITLEELLSSDLGTEYRARVLRWLLAEAEYKQSEAQA